MGTIQVHTTKPLSHVLYYMKMNHVCFHPTISRKIQEISVQKLRQVANTNQGASLTRVLASQCIKYTIIQ
jgi:hypothetical protein